MQILETHKLTYLDRYIYFGSTGQKSWVSRTNLNNTAVNGYLIKFKPGEL